MVGYIEPAVGIPCHGRGHWFNPSTAHQLNKLFSKLQSFA